jgi:hypothetical protein
MIEIDSKLSGVNSGWVIDGNEVTTDKDVKIEKSIPKLTLSDGSTNAYISYADNAVFSTSKI